MVAGRGVVCAFATRASRGARRQQVRGAAGLAALALVAGCSSGSAAPSGAPGSSGASPSASASAARPHAPATASGADGRLMVGVASWRLPAARSREVVVAVDGELVAAGGLDAGQASTSTVWWLDPKTDALTARASLARAAHDAAGFVLGSTAYVVGGGEPSIAAVSRIGRSGTAVDVASMPQGRSDLVSAVLDGSAYVLGGYDGSNEVPTVLRVDGRTVTTVGRLAVPVRYPGVAVVGGRVLLFGGSHLGNAIRSIQAFDPATGRVSVIGALPVPLAHESALVLGGAVYLAGGRSNATLQTRVWRWDPATGTARVVAALPYPVADAGSAVVGGVGYLLGGETPAQTARVVTLSLR